MYSVLTIIFALSIVPHSRILKFIDPVNTSLNARILRTPSDTLIVPSISVRDTIVADMLVITIHDTATKEQLPQHLQSCYAELFAFIAKNSLKPRKLVGSYYPTSTGFIFDVSIEVDSLPKVTSGRVKIDMIKGGQAIVAHYTGPYERLSIAYIALEKRLKTQGQAPARQPFEVYLNDPSSTKPTALRTDVYQILK